MPRKRVPISSQLRKLFRRLTQFRQTHPRRTRIPEQFWEAATSLAGREGLYRTARTLRLDYANLRKRVEMSSQKGRSLQKTSYRTAAARPSPRTSVETLGPTETASRKRRTPPAEFVELLSDSIGADCLIEVEGGGGARLRIQMRMSAPEVLTLVRDWRDRSVEARERQG